MMLKLYGSPYIKSIFFQKYRRRLPYFLHFVCDIPHQKAKNVEEPTLLSDTFALNLVILYMFSFHSSIYKINNEIICSCHRFDQSFKGPAYSAPKCLYQAPDRICLWPRRQLVARRAKYPGSEMEPGYFLHVFSVVFLRMCAQGIKPCSVHPFINAIWKDLCIMILHGAKHGLASDTKASRIKPQNRFPLP